MRYGDSGKRLILGRKLRSGQISETLLPKRVALPVFASDALSSVAYAPDEIFITLAAAGLTAYTFSWKIGIAVALVMATVVASYRQNVQAYQSGGGDYEVATTNLGPPVGLAVASALFVDYVLTVAVSISSAAQYAASAIDPLREHEVTLAVVATIFLMAVNLRGVKESGTAFAIPTYLFMAAILAMAAWGFWRYFTDGLPPAPTADYSIVATDELANGITGLAGALLLLRAFSSGCAALTGVEAISNGVPAFRKPKGRNAATTLLMLGAIAITMGLSIIALANITDVRVVLDPATELRDPTGELVGAQFQQVPVIGQLAQSVFSDFDPGFYVVTATTGLILVLASNTAFNGFPVLGSILARDGYFPRQLHTRGDRLAYSNGIFLLAAFAILLIVAFDARVTSLIPLYTVGVFVAFTCSQTGMVRHWTRLLRTESNPATRRRMQRSRAINGLGLTVTGLVLAVVLSTKFLLGAWITVAAMVVLYFLMRAIRHHYEMVREEIAVEDEDVTLPSRVHAIVLVSKLHKPTVRAINYARAARPSVLEAVTVDVDPDATAALMDDWDRHRIPVPLKVLDSPYREVTRPILGYVSNIHRASPRDVVAVYVPEYVVGHWWEQLLHNQSALRLKTRLRLRPGVMVISVPFQLASSARMDERGEHPVAAGDVRRGSSRV